jgi:hypothetical protein
MLLSEGRFGALPVRGSSSDRFVNHAGKPTEWRASRSEVAGSAFGSVANQNRFPGSRPARTTQPLAFPASTPTLTPCVSSFPPRLSR